MGSELNGMVLDGFDRKLMRLALFASTMSRDPSTKVGAVIVNASGRVIGSGYNCVPAGVTTTDRAHRLACTIHAETNAILSTRSPYLYCATIYVTHPPCCNCAALIASVGIKRVVHMAPSPEFAERWHESLGRAQALLAECNIVAAELARS